MKISAKGKMTKKEAKEFCEMISRARKTKIDLSINMTTEEVRMEEKDGKAKKLLDFPLQLYTVCGCNWYCGFAVWIVISIILSLLIGIYFVPCIQNKLPLFISEDTGHYLLSSIFQGFAALFAMGAAAVAFRWEYLKSIGKREDWLKYVTTIVFANIGFTLLITMIALALFDAGEELRHSLYILVLFWASFSLVHFGLLLYKIFALGIKKEI
jgi:hypothetical protein